MSQDQNPDQSTDSQQAQRNTSASHDSNSAGSVAVYVPVEGQGPDYVSKGAGAGKS